MKKYSLLESSIIGLFVGVVVSSYLVFLEGTGMYIGQILNWVSLRPLIGLFNISPDETILYNFLFFIITFIFYGIVIGFFVRNSRKKLFVFLVLILLIFIGIVFQQYNNRHVSLADSSTVNTIESTPLIHEQYFGKETSGDLNNDKKDDIAFLLVHNDKNKGGQYYLAAATKVNKGYLGTNILFLGNDVNPKGLSIKDGKIDVEYIDLLDKKATSTKNMYAQIIDGELVESTSSANSTSSVNVKI